MARRVLIVDDEADLSELLAYNLWKAGYESRVARDGLEGLRLVGEFSPHIILLDLMMPGLSGQEVLSRLRADPATESVPVNLMAGWRGKTVASSICVVTCPAGNCLPTPSIPWSESLGNKTPQTI